MLKTFWVTILFCVFIANNSFAGTSCPKERATTATIVTATEQATLVRDYLNEQKAVVALIARVGSDVSKYKMHYTHFSFVIKNPGDKEWKAIHLLNACGTATSGIYEQGLANFFLDNLFKMDVKIVVPTPAVQKKLAVILNSNKVTSFHNSNYSMIAYPFSTKYQQSNQWILELLASALDGANDRKEAHDYLQRSGFTPTVIPISIFSKIGAYFFKKHVSFNDHPEQEVKDGKYSVVTVDSIVDYLNKRHLISAEKEFRN